MKFIVYSVKDELVAFNRPFYVQDNGRADMIAIRSFKEAFKNDVFGDTAIDCNLYKIGTFENTTGTHENYRFPELLVSGKELITEKEYEISEDV